MTGRADRLAHEFTEANDTLIRLLEQTTPEQWQHKTRDDGELRTLGVIANHVAWAHEHINARVRAFAAGQPVSARRPDLFDERNARFARENPDPSQTETLAWLRRDGEHVAATIGALSDMQLDRRSREDADAPELTTAEVIELRQIGHVLAHIVSVRTVLGRVTSGTE